VQVLVVIPMGASVNLIGKDQRFWSLAQAFSALYAAASDEKRWVDGVLARKKGLGFSISQRLQQSKSERRYCNEDRH
jgi:hypothetical protein